MTSKEYSNYKLVANKILNLLINEKYSSIYDISVLYHIIRGFPYCLDIEGHYTYQGKFYYCLEELPIEALQQIKAVNYHL